jgi:UDP-N-acetylmuramoylalanine--D-glutamate ligase
VIGITGASGKSTTTALVGAIATEAGANPVVGGNLGEALLGRLGEIRSDSTVIIEISHTQLQYTTRSPHIGAVTNVTPNHLDQFSWDEYVGLKRNLLLHQGVDDVAVLNADDNTSRQFVTEVRGRLFRTSISGEVRGDGAWYEADKVRVRASGRAQAVVHRSDIRLRGQHNLANVVMACAVSAAAGIPVGAMAPAISAFRGVPHRLEIVGRALGATWVNDSIATSPERTVAGLNAFNEPVVLLLGGREKKLPLDILQRTAASRCRAVVCFGEAAQLFCEAMRWSVTDVRVTASLTDAVAEAAALVHPGDAVLLSPAGTSFDAFPTFEVRGQAFRDLVRALPDFEEAV